MGIKKVKNPMNAMVAPRSASKTRVRGQLGQDTHIDGNARFTITTTTGGWSTGAVRCDMTGASSPVTAVGGLYQQFLFKPGTAFNYVPSVGLSTSGNIMVGWLDNPELMSQFVQGNDSVKQSIISTLANVKVYPIWQAFSYSLTAPPRLKRFDVNDTFSTDAGGQITTEYQRSCQGMFVYNVINAPVSTLVSFSYLHAKLQLWGLTGAYGT